MKPGQGIGADDRRGTRRTDFSYEVPGELVAQHPLEVREEARLLVCSRSDPSFVEHATIRALPEYLTAGDRLVLNETKVLPHRLLGRRASGGRVECLILERRGTEAWGFLRPSKRLRVGERLLFEDAALGMTLLAAGERGRWQFRLEIPAELDSEADGGPETAQKLTELLERIGRAPLPPYLDRDPDSEDVAADRRCYQSVFAKHPGAVAAPTASLHLTDELLAELARRGVERSPVPLHVGEGTFEPLRAELIEEHEMHEEAYELSAASARAIEASKAAGGRIVCVGTTSARVLESCWDAAAACLREGAGRTRLFLYPGKGPRCLDILLTNFHLPESTLLLLVASLLGRERTLELYALAIRERYRFFSFGDAMLILP